MKYFGGIIIFLSIISGVSAQTGSPLFDSPRIRLTDSVECNPVEDQSQSPTCWAFGTISVIESDLIRKNGMYINLSEMFLARHAYIDKAKRHIETGGKTYVEGGGQFRDVMRVVERYGIVPEQVYPGRPRGEAAHNHTEFNSSMKKMVDQIVVSGRRELSDHDLTRLNDTLDKYLGRLPTRFMWQGKEYTAKSFAEQVIGFSNDYVELVSFSDQPLYGQFILRDKWNWADDSFYNVSLPDMMMVVDTSLAKGWSVGWEGDVTNKNFNYFSGIAAHAAPGRDPDKERLGNYKSQTTERDHMLHIVAVGKDDTKKKWYQMKNSWGTFLSMYDGYLFMEENYFNLQTVILLVNKSALPVQLRLKLGLP